ncbi:Copper fist DNA-binding protein [Ascosphaera apis ARSEF 7405]|uniref:Copper fist DNA-binding protein n=1 Tax=Ascosphaera apis ARSEF 7405 TaxID=392613 RepID=A0A167WH94_9EURO|nr:Copper fist DNA-binding protein [Ascosphaera apis ARSEF 7405]
MPLDEQGAKWACEPCIRGHRSSKCEHFDRLMVKVAKAGRPLMKCPHPGQACDCQKKYALMVRIPKASKGQSPPAIPEDLVQRTTKSEAANGRHGSVSSDSGNSNNQNGSRATKSISRSSKSSCCSITPPARTSRAEKKLFKEEPQTSEESCCSSNLSTRKRISPTQDIEEPECFRGDITPKPPSGTARTRPAIKRNRTSPPNMPEEIPRNSAKSNECTAFDLQTTTAPGPATTNSCPLLSDSVEQPLIVGSHLMSIPENDIAPTNPPPQAPKRLFGGAPEWVNTKQCHCGPSCQCLGCETHPYNEATMQAMQELGEMMFADQSQMSKEYEAPTNPALTVTDYSQCPYVTQPSYNAYSQNPYLPGPYWSTGSDPFFMLDAPSQYGFNPELANFGSTAPAVNANFDPATTSDNQCAVYGDQMNLPQNNTDGIVMVPNAYWQLEYSLPMANPCTNTMGTCKCGEKCICVGCITHTGHDGISLPPDICTTEGMQQHFFNFMPSSVPAPVPQHAPTPPPVYHEVTHEMPMQEGLFGLGLTIPGITRPPSIPSHCSTPTADYVDNTSQQATVSRG